MRCITGEGAGVVVRSIAADGAVEAGFEVIEVERAGFEVIEVERAGIVGVEVSGVIVAGRAGTAAVEGVGSEASAAVVRPLNEHSSVIHPTADDYPLVGQEARSS